MLEHWIKWFVINVLFTVIMVIAIVYGGGFENVFFAGTWLFIISSLALLVPEFHDAMLEEGIENFVFEIPRWLDVGLDVLIVGILVFVGWWWYAIAYLFVFIVNAVFHTEVMKGVNQQKN